MNADLKGSSDPLFWSSRLNRTVSCFLKFDIKPVPFCARACSLTCTRLSWVLFLKDVFIRCQRCFCCLCVFSSHHAPSGFLQKQNPSQVCLSDRMKPKNTRQTVCEGLVRHLLVQSGNVQFSIGWKSSNLFMSVWFKRHAAHYLRMMYNPHTHMHARTRTHTFLSSH